MSTTSDRSPHNSRPDAENQWERVEEPITITSTRAIRSQSESPEIYQAQETLYKFLLEAVKQWPPEEVLLEFKRLFLYHVDLASSETTHAV
ncbi:MAG TPA: hypothetical protein VL134_03125, partial [Leptolyngbya sp.]|nr:hypothetical protein [Leptolyngbya sp.]